VRDVTSDEKENGIGNQQSYELKRKEKKSTRTAYCLQTPKKKAHRKGQTELFHVDHLSKKATI
jgi:hypothetical protein